MKKHYNTADLTAQIVKRLNLKEDEGCALYDELSQISNGLVKDVLAGLLEGPVPAKTHRYAACIRSESVTAACYQPAAGCDPVEMENPELFIGFADAETPTRAGQIAGAQHRINPEILILHEV